MSKSSSKTSSTQLDDDDPCAKELGLSMKCLREKNQNKNQCQDYLKNLDHCRYFWLWIQSARQKEGIKPPMPPPQEREQVKQKYLPLIKPPAD